MFRFNVPDTGRPVGELPVDPSKCDPAKIRELRKYPKLIEMLDNWVLIQDYDLLPHILKLGEIVEKMYQIGDIPIYRGFSVNRLSKYQNTMSLTVDTLFGRKLRPEVKVGYKFDYDTPSTLSFASNLRIAKCFALGLGNHVVVEAVRKKGTPRLVVTDELCLVTCELRNIKPVTQTEVIVAPPQKLSCRVLQI